MSVATSLTVAELIGDIVGDHDTRLDTAEGDISTLQNDLATAQSDISNNSGNISTLQSDVSTAQSDISTNQGDISTLQSDVSTAQSDISTNQSDISTLQSDVSTAQSDISTNQSDISTLQSDVSTAQSDISTNQSNISTLQSDVSTAQSDISTNQGNISTLQSDVSTAQSDISTNQGNISTLQSDVSTAQSDISTNQGNISTLQSDVSTAQSDISTNQGNISTLQSDVSTAQSDISSLQSDKLAASDTRIPTQDENDALVGTGTPGSSDPFVNDSDSRLLQAQNFEIAAKNLSANDDRVVVVCDAATTADIDIDSATPSDTYDGVTLAAFDVLMVHNQADASENGAYIFTDTSTQLSRYVGLNTSAGFAGRKRQFVVREGDTQKGVYISDEASGFTLDTDDLEFVCAIANPGRQTSSADLHQFKQAGFYRDETNDTLWVVWTDISGTHRYRVNTEIHAFPERDFYGPPHKFGPRIVGHDGGVIVIHGNAGYLVDGTTGIRYQFTLSAIDKNEAFDVESAIDGENLLGLGSTELYSLLTGDSDTKGFNGDPVCMDFKVLPVGGVAPAMILSSKGDLPDGRMVNNRQVRQRAFLGDISEFMSFAQAGEEGQNNIADTAILDGAGNTLNTNLDKDERFYCVRGAAPILNGTARHITGVTSAVNSTKIRFTVPGVDLSQELSTDDHILIYGSDGENCNGKHQVTGVTYSDPDTLIDVNTDHTAGDATMGTIRALARLKKITSTVV
jgi:peptidoglycan hydrolase CwlO-like protein